MNAEAKSSTPQIKALLFVIFIAAAILVFRFTPLRQYLHPQALKDLFAGSGPLAPFLFILAYGIGICLFLPATLFTGLGALLFGAFFGFIYNVTGAMLGASGAFFIGRYLGRDFAASLIGDRLAKYDAKIADNGFAVTLYLRLVFFPFTPLNFGMALTRISFARYFWGTFFGILAGGFVMTFFFATISEVWSNGQWEKLWGWKSLLSLTLFVASFFIPGVVRHFKPDI
ncbi:MAG: hypothetical protein AMJ60_08150 [Desulfobacterales bacterium SG8_35]|nr:MAG: hypothetical protein AMJ60_08150 [Desulfobacterales bacterium SG8_35]